MTTDERISKDLAVVGRVSRERPIALETTLRQVGLLRDPATGQPTLHASAAGWLSLSHLYALRVARTSAGIAAFACTVVLILFTVFANELGARSPHLLDQLAWMSKLWVAGLAMLVVSCCYIVSFRAALRRFHHAAASNAAAGPRLVRAAAAPSVVAPTLGINAFILFFGMMQVTLGGWGLGGLFHFGPTAGWMQLTVARWTITFLVVAIAGVLVGAALIVRRQVPPSTLWTVIGIVFLMATGLVGIQFDAGAHPVDSADSMPSMLLRGCLTTTGTLGLFLIVSNVVRRVRMREDGEAARSQQQLVTSAGG